MGYVRHPSLVPIRKWADWFCLPFLNTSFSSLSPTFSRKYDKASLARTFKNPLLAEAAELAKAQRATHAAGLTSNSAPNAAQTAPNSNFHGATDAPKRSRWLDEDEEASKPEPESSARVKRRHSPIVWDDGKTARTDRPRSAGAGLSAAERALAEVEEFRRRRAELATETDDETKATRADHESDGQSVEPFMATSPDISSPEEEMHIRREANSYHALAGLDRAPPSISPGESLEGTRSRGSVSPAPGPRPASPPGSNERVEAYPELEGYPEVEAYEEEEDQAPGASPRQVSSDREEDHHCASPSGLDVSVPAKRQVSMLNECRSVENYEKLNRISEGTYGVVYRARDRETGAICALKKVKLDKERDGFPLTSVREINVLLSLSHPCIVNVSEVVVGSSLDMVFMVMEYADHDLKSVMDRRMSQPFSTAEIKCLMRQLLDGVAYLHANWVIHRDLKTSNILYNNRGQLKICDFGLARQYGEPLKPYSQLVVTLWYRAPELLLGGRMYSTPIDVWSCGCIMGELLAKAPLFPGQNELGQLDAIFRTLGYPTPATWPGIEELPLFRKFGFKGSGQGILRARFPPPGPVFNGRPTLSEAGYDLLSGLLELCPVSRLLIYFQFPLSYFEVFLTLGGEL